MKACIPRSDIDFGAHLPLGTHVLQVHLHDILTGLGVRRRKQLIEDELALK